MTIFNKCFSTKEQKEFIACIEEKTVYLSTLDGVIYKQVSRSTFVGVNPKETSFPGNYELSLAMFKDDERKKTNQPESKKALKKRLEAEKIYKERKKKVLFVRSARNLALRSDTVTIYCRGLYDLSWHWDYEYGNGSWETFEEGYNWEYFLDESQMRDIEELKGGIDYIPKEVAFYSYILSSEDILNITNYDDLINLVDNSRNIGIEEWIELRPDYKSLEGSILVEWSRKHGSSREKIESLFVASSEDTEELLYQETDYDGTRLLLSADEIEKKTQQELRECLLWYLDKYQIEYSIKDFLEMYASREVIDLCGLDDVISYKLPI